MKKPVHPAEIPPSEQMVAMNEALILGALRQHELREAAQALNERLQEEICERKQAEETVRLSEIRYRRLFEAAHDGVLLLDPRTRLITDANPYMNKLLGYTRGQLIGKELFQIGLLKDESASRKMFRKLKREREVRYENLPLENQDGRHQEVEVVANLYQENGHAVIQCNIRDITERKLVQDILRRNEALFTALIQQAPIGVYAVDSGLRLQQVNTSALPVFRNVDPLIGRDFEEAIGIIWSKRVAAELVARFRETLKTGESYFSNEFKARRKDLGVSEIYEWQIHRVTLPAGEFGVVCFFNDITEKRKTESAELRLAVLTESNLKLKKEIIRRKLVEGSLKESQRSQESLLKSSRQQQGRLRELSHEIIRVQEDERKRISRELHDVIAQTLVGLNVHVSALARETADAAKDLRDRIARTQLLVEESVDTVHRFAGELRPTVLDDLGLIPAMQSFLDSFIAKTGIQVNFEACEGVEEGSDSLRTMLFRVAQEAMTNISRHAKASLVRITLKRTPRVIFMEITDNGQGFDAEARNPKRGANRLGLVGMRERVEMLGGTFQVESSPGKSTSIRVEIGVEGVDSTKRPGGRKAH
jgi:PAS domain S-box-containing protein